MSSPTKLLALGLLAVVSVACKPDPNAPPIYRDANEYQAALERVQTLTKGPFEAMHEGQPISEREKEGLKEANKLIDGLIAYNPDSYAPYILRGLTKRSLGDKEGAVLAYEQGIALSPKEPNEIESAAVGRIYDELGTLYFEEQDFVKAETYADKATQLVPLDPSILTNTASVKIQLKKTEEAKVLLASALRLVPTYKRALDLQKLLKLSQGK